jgi:DNA-binding transcriptional regulator of glucitol operon
MGMILIFVLEFILALMVVYLWQMHKFNKEIENQRFCDAWKSSVRFISNISNALVTPKEAEKIRCGTMLHRVNK